jgi:hypothetical protein
VKDKLLHDLMVWQMSMVIGGRRKKEEEVEDLNKKNIWRY